MTNSHNRTSAVATASSGRSPGDRNAHGTNLNTSSPNNHHHHSNNNHHQHQTNHHSNSITLLGNNDGSNSSGGGGGYFSNRKLNHRNNPGGWHQRTSGSSNASRCAGGNNLLPSSSRGESRSTGSGNRYHHHGKTAGNHHNHHYNNNHYTNGRAANGIQILMGSGIGRRGVSPPALLPSSLTHFASSKCFDAPAPTALPKPPQHWTTTSQSGSANCDRDLIGRAREKSSAKRSLIDEFDTHNLKMILNVQS